MSATSVESPKSACFTICEAYAAARTINEDVALRHDAIWAPAQENLDGDACNDNGFKG